MKTKRILTLLLFLCSLLGHAQELKIKSFSLSLDDISASTNVRKDNNGVPCALVKVQLAREGATFKGLIMGDVAFNVNEYWVYMPQRSSNLTVNLPGFVPLHVDFAKESGGAVKRLESKATYILTVLLPDWALAAGVQQSNTSQQTATTPKPNVATTQPTSSNAPITLTAEEKIALNSLTDKELVQKALTGDAEALFSVAESFDYGVGGAPKDYEKAVKYYRLAAEQGHAGAQCNLGFCYDEGQGVTQSYTEAVKYYRLAAEQGHATAQCNLGLCYEKGQGVTLSKEEAIKWYKKAAQQGDSRAKEALQRLGVSGY